MDPPVTPLELTFSSLSLTFRFCFNNSEYAINPKFCYLHTVSFYAFDALDFILEEPVDEMDQIFYATGPNARISHSACVSADDVASHEIH